MTKASNDISSKTTEAQKLLETGQFQAAEAICIAELEIDPKNGEFLYILSVSHRLQGKHKQSLETLEKLVNVRPGYGRAYQEKGINYQTISNLPKAGVSFEKAVSLDPSLISSWKNLAKLYKMAGNESQASIAQLQSEFLSTLPNELLNVMSYMSEGRLEDAERLCRFFLKRNKTHVEAMRLLAELATLNKVFEDAEFLLESCLEFEPDHTNAKIQYVNLLLRSQKFNQAATIAKQLNADHPEDTNNILALYASASSGVGDNSEAISAYLKLIQSHPENHFYLTSLAHVYKAEGQFDEAVNYYQKAYTLKPEYGDAYWSLANTKRYQFSENEIEQMLVQVSKETTEEIDSAQISFALGKAYEDTKNFEDSFKYYKKGNAIKNSRAHHNGKQLQQRINAQINMCTPNLFESKKDLGLDNPAPIFIVGLPRSGSTLIEQILSSHSQVDGTMELHNILNLAKRLRGKGDSLDSNPRYPAILAEIDESFFKKFGEQFIAETQTYRQDAPYFIDKMPNNFFHIGLIKLILPNAKIIDARRHPMSCCFSGYKQLFGEGQEFSYGLTEIGNYYRQYLKLMDHWDAVLPDFVHLVQHEDVVEDLEKEVRKLLAFCDLPFEQNCIDYHKTERNVRTPSSEQVRQPIFTTSLDLWRNYEDKLAPLKTALGPEVFERYPIE
ncbi:MAG: tetratricopeptide (TPR) repeat protein [Flavobacterium sp.]|jgi:tetratricopeptide (TPR) repeat protein